MTAAQAPSAPAFSPRAVLGLVLIGAGLFVALLWMIGAGMTSGSTNDGGAHAGGKGLTGYGALADYLERGGRTVRRSMSEAALDDSGLLVLTPPHGADGKEISRIVEQRRYIGPTLVITPKWIAMPQPASPQVKKGWVMLIDAQGPEWPGFLDGVTVSVDAVAEPGQPGRWTDAWGSGPLADPARVLSGKGKNLVPLVADARHGRILAAWINDGGDHPALEDATLGDLPALPDETDSDIYPLVVVFEPDLLDNYGFASRETAELAAHLIDLAAAETDGPVIFDLTLNGHARSANLLTLAFTPPYLAATLCLILAALAVGWRAFLRFGPAARPGRGIAFGKRALVANAAGLVARAGRLRLVATPYADAVRERLARALALPRLRDAAATEAAIDRALAGRRADGEPFSALAAHLRGARTPADMLRAAQALHSLERTLTR